MTEFCVIKYDTSSWIQFGFNRIMNLWSRDLRTYSGESLEHVELTNTGSNQCFILVHMLQSGYIALVHILIPKNIPNQVWNWLYTQVILMPYQPKYWVLWYYWWYQYSCFNGVMYIWIVGISVLVSGDDYGGRCEVWLWKCFRFFVIPCSNLWLLQWWNFGVVALDCDDLLRLADVLFIEVGKYFVS